MSDLGAILETGGAAAVEYAASKIVEHGGRPGTCANCREPLIGPFCAVCGQPRDVHRRSIWGLLHDLVKDMVSFDSRILRTARALMIQPGELARAYREGRTQPFVPPVRLYLFVSLLFFVALSATHIALMQFQLVTSPMTIEIGADHKPYGVIGGEKFKLPARYADGKPHYNVASSTTFFSKLGTIRGAPPPAVLADLDRRMKMGTDNQLSWITRGVNSALHKLATDPGALNGAITEWVPRALFAILPLFAVLLSIFYWGMRRDFFFVDHLVFSLNYHSFGFMMLLVAAGAAQFLPGPLVAWGVVILMGLYLLLALRRVYAQSWLRTVVKFVAISLIYVCLFLFPAFVAILALSIFDGGAA